MEKNSITRAIEVLGTQLSLAKQIGVTPQFISQLANGTRPVPATLVLKIEKATGSQVTRYELRPDIFGESQAA